MKLFKQTAYIKFENGETATIDYVEQIRVVGDMMCFVVNDPVTNSRHITYYPVRNIACCLNNYALLPDEDKGENIQ